MTSPLLSGDLRAAGNPGSEVACTGHTPRADSGDGCPTALRMGIRRAHLRTRAPWARSAYCTQFTTPAGLAPAPPTPRALAANAEGPSALAHQWENSLGMMDVTPSTNGC